MKINVAKSLKGLKKIQPNNILKEILNIRGIENYDSFLNPKLPIEFTLHDFGFNKNQINQLLKILIKCYRSNKKIIVYTDYDADGITGGAILWETLHLIGFKTVPYVPNRKLEGYGFSEIGIRKVKTLHDPGLIISVDHGITAIKQIALAKELGMPVVVTDHHHKQQETPKEAEVIFHIPSLSGSATAYYVAKEIFESIRILEDEKIIVENKKLQILENHFKNDYIALASIGTVADLVPLLEKSRSIAYHGLNRIHTSNRVGLKKLLEVAKIDRDIITTYDVGFLIAPRINAVGRLDDALDALRLLCTNKEEKARELSIKVSDINIKRQELVKKNVEDAIFKIENEKTLPKIIILENEQWHEGVIGLIASKILEKFYRPTIILTKSDNVYKASVRSINDFHITDFLTQFKNLLLGFGGHKAAAGFTIAANNFKYFKNQVLKIADKQITEAMLERKINVDIEIDVDLLNFDLYKILLKLEPYGVGNSKPMFLSQGKIKDIQYIGKDKSHLRFKASNEHQKNNTSIDMIYFNGSSEIVNFDFSRPVNLIYNLENNVWNGRSRLQANIKHILPLEVEIKRGIMV